MLHSVVKRPNARWRLFEEIARTASDVDAIKCTDGWMWCQACCIWCWDHQMHWRSCLDASTLHPAPSRSDERQLMPKLLHPIAIKLDARWRLSEEIARAASNADAIRCTGGCLKKLPRLHLMPMPSDALTIVWKNCQNCIWCRCHQMHWRLSRCQGGCIWSRTIRCTDEVVCDVKWLHPMLMHQMHWRSCLIVRLLHSTVKRSDARWRLSVAKVRWSDVFRDETPKVASDAEIVECTSDFVCFIVCYRVEERTNS